MIKNTWGSIYMKNIALGKDHGSAALAADNWEKRKNKEDPINEDALSQGMAAFYDVSIRDIRLPEYEESRHAFSACIRAYCTTVREKEGS